MCEQYVGGGNGHVLDSESITAGEYYVAALTAYGLVETPGNDP